MNDINPTAIVSPTAAIGERNMIGPFCVIGPNVTIGDDNRFEAYVAVGTPGEHRDYFRERPGRVHIGNHNVFREHVAVTGGTIATTIVESDVVLMRGAHLGHDVVVKNSATLSWNVLIAGHTIIGHGANLGLATVVHQRRVVGAYSMIGMHSTVTRNIVPFIVSFGSPARPQRLNAIGLQRSGITEAELPAFDRWFRELDPDAERPLTIAHPYSRFIDDFLADCRSLREPHQP